MADIPERLEWDESLSVHVLILDAQHKRFIEIINDLLKAIKTHQVKGRIRQIMDQLIDSEIKEHFATEERFFAQCHYPDASAHKREHNMFKARIEEIRLHMETDETAASFALVDYLEDWFISHLAEYDQRYVQCFHDHGLR